MKKVLQLAIGFILTTTLLAVAAGIYAPDGSMFVTLANGVSSGLYAPDGSYRVTLTTAIQAIAFIATGGVSASSQADRATYNGVSFDARGDLGLVCDGTTDDTTKFAAIITKYGATTTPVVVTFPAICAMQYAAYVITGNLSFKGIAGGGIKLTSAPIATGSFLRWNSTTYDISVTNFVLDLNSQAIPAAVGFQPFFFLNNLNVTFSDNTIKNGGTIGTGGNTLFVYGQGLAAGTFARNNITLITASPANNQCIDVGSSSNINILDNKCYNTAISAFSVVNAYNISRNLVNGWGFGAGITFEPPGVTDAVFKNSVIADNVITNSLSAPDNLTTYLDGIEAGYNGIDIHGNTIYSTCGPGISFFGQMSIHGNIIADTGKCNFSDLVNSAITAVTPGGTNNNPSGSNIYGNSAYEDGGGHTSYGYADQTSVSGVTLGANNFHGLKGSTNIVGGVNFSAAQSDNRIVNPCMVIDQRNAGAAINSGKSVDQWQLLQTGGGTLTVAQTTATMGECTSTLTATVITSGAPGSADFREIFQNIAVADVQDFRFAFPTAKDLIFSFKVKSSLTPPFTGDWLCQNNNAGFSYVGQYTLTAAAGTVQTFSFTIPGDTAHSLGTTPTAIAMKCAFNLGVGTGHLTASLNQWVSGSFFGSTTSTPFVTEPNGSTLSFSAVRLLPAGADNGWVPPTYAEMLRNAQRFAWTTVVSGTKPAAALGTNTGEIQFPALIAAAGVDVLTIRNPVPMLLSTGTVTFFSPATAASATCRDETAGAGAGADGGAASASNQSVLGFLLSCAGNAATTIGNTLGTHILVDRVL